MGIDIDCYRCRIGTFVGHHGAGVMCMPFYFDFSVMIKVIGTAIFVRLLLIMAGIEQNPGPGKNVVQHLTAKSRDIHSLRAITADQKQFLPPIDNKPDSSIFDITLLSCLLRNICGLRQPKDLVWTNPASTDTSVEADITRLRTCRNLLMHSDKLVLPEAELNSKWQDLSAILLRLNPVGVAGIVHLQSFIDNAESMDIDEQLRKEFNQTINQWHESDRLLKQELEEVKSEVVNVKHDVNNVKQDVVGVKRKLEVVERTQEEMIKREQTQEEMKRQRVVEFTDIQNDLIEFYKRCCKTLPVSPLFENKDDNILDVYKHPTMYSVEGTKQTKEITRYEDIFCKDSKSCNQIYMTGDAGMGKTSFCTFMCFLWSVGKSGDKVNEEQRTLQTDVDYMSKFDFVFHITLRDTEQNDVTDMIKEQYLKHYDPLTIQDILRKKHCLILMDGLDEWTPKKEGKKVHKLPKRMYVENCVYLTTCRPYRIEQMRLSHIRDIDQKLELMGIHGEAAVSYVKHVICYMNKEISSNRKSDEFECEVRNCGLDDQLCIPMIASHLVVLWYEKVTLTNMSRACIYANILEMLFKRAEQTEVQFPSPTSTARILQLPDCFSGLEYLNKHVSLLYNVCHLSFISLFKQDENVPSLVFTRQQLLAEPYCISIEESEVLCKIGIFSKNEVFGVFSVERLKISFIHKSYMEFLAALFISTFDTKDLFSDVTNSWKSLNVVLQFENFFPLLAGLSHDCVRSLFETMYHSISSDLTLCRINDRFRYKSCIESSINSLQIITVKCYKEASRSNDANIVLKLDDFIFDDFSDEILQKLLLINITSVKSIHSVNGKYYDEFDLIKNLQCLFVGEVLSADYVKFTECMLQNQSTLHTICIEWGTLLPELPVSRLQHLTSLSLFHVDMQYDSLHKLGKFLSDNVLIENIRLSSVCCYGVGGRCQVTLNLPDHTKLTSLCLKDVYIVCNNVNMSSLKSITLGPLVDSRYTPVFNCINDSQLEYLNVNGSPLDGLDISIDLYNTWKTFACTLKTLLYIKSLILRDMNLPNDIFLQLHPDVTQVKIVLECVRMTRQSFHSFIESFVNNKTVIKVKLCRVKIRSGETHRELSVQESFKYMSEYLTPIPTVNITMSRKSDYVLTLETRRCR